MKKDIFRAKIEADEGIKDIFDPFEDATAEYAHALHSEIKELKGRLERLEAAYEVYHELDKMGLDLYEDVAQATFMAALKEEKLGHTELAQKLLLASENGCAKARVAHGKALIYGGFGLKKAPKTGLDLIKEEADQDDAEACFLLCKIHEDYPRLVDADTALEMCQKAASLGLEEASNRLQQPFDMSAETKRLLALAKKGEKGVRFWLSTRGDLPSEERAKFFFEAVKEGDPTAEFEMGSTLLEEGDRDGAAAYYQKAIDHGNGPACFALIDLILNGKPHYYKGPDLPDPNDPIYQKELSLVERCAEIGDNRGLVVLGRSYVRGYMVEKDYEKAKPYLLKALEQGEVDLAPQMLGEIYENSDGKGTAEKAVEYYELASNHGNVASMVALTRIYENGLRDIKKDKAKAMLYSHLSRQEHW